MIHVGVDLHQRFCYVTVMDARGKILQQRAVGNEGGELKRWARSLPGPAQVVMEACSFWPAFQKNLSGEVEKMVLVHPARVKAIAAAGLEQVELSAAGRESVDTYRELIDHYDRLIGERQQKLEQAAEQSAEAKWLATIPGIGPYLAMVIVAEIGDIARFSDKKALANYAGLVPRVRESAGKRHAGGLTYQGSKLLRWAMIQAAHGATRSSPAIATWYEKRRQRKRPQVARVALARKLLTCVWALLRHGVCFEETVFATG